MAKLIRNFFISFLTVFFTKWLEDFFILMGIGMIIYTTYLITVAEINIIAGNYLLGVVLIIVGVVLAKR